MDLRTPVVATIFVFLASVVAPAHGALVIVGGERLHVETIGAIADAAGNHRSRSVSCLYLISGESYGSG